MKALARYFAILPIALIAAGAYGASGSVKLGPTVLPNRIFDADFERSKDLESQSPGAGMVARFQGESAMRVDVFSYSNREKSVPQGPGAPLVVEEFNRSDKEVRSAWHITDQGTTIPGKCFRARMYTLPPEKGEHPTLLAMTGQGNQFLKVRITWERFTNDPKGKASDILSTLCDDLARLNGGAKSAGR